MTIEEAIAKFLVYEHTTPRRHSSSKRVGKAAPATMRGYRGLLGNVVVEDGSVVVKHLGRLLAWRNSVVPRPVYISDLTATLVDDFRASWNAPAKGIPSSAPFGDLMTWVSFKRLKTFFEYCKTRGKWISENPLDGIALPTTADGYRTAPFTKEQYSSILSAVENRYPAEIKNPEDQKQYNDAHRLRAFIELMRWGGMAVADAVQFRLSSVKANGHVTFRRVKTGEEAEPTLPNRVVALLKEIVPIDADPDRPFYDKDILPESNRDRWSGWAKEIFTEAGILTVTTAVRDREPHLHMMRDTFVVNQIRVQKGLGIVDLDSIAKAIGDSVATLRKHYAPWVKELEDAHRDSQQRIVDAQMQEETDAETREPKVVNISGGRK